VDFARTSSCISSKIGDRAQVIEARVCAAFNSIVRTSRAEAAVAAFVFVARGVRSS